MTVQNNKIKIVIICGPTGSGKTALSLELAKTLKAEIVMADSQSVLKGFDIGTAKPSLDERKQIPHHLIDVAEFGEVFDAAQFTQLADQTISEIVSRGKIPLISGGTGLYIKALLHGFMEAPKRDGDFRKTLEERIKTEGLNSLYEELQKIDPTRASEIHANDTHRIIRALEIFHLSGEKPSDLAKIHQFQERKYNALKIGISPEREELYRRIDQRVLSMLNHGWVEEVKNLMKKYDLIQGRTQTIGYPTLARYVNGEIFINDAIQEIQQETRNLAKRQLAWFRADKEIQWFEPDQKDEILKISKEFLDLPA